MNDKKEPIRISLGNGFVLAVDCGVDSSYPNEVYIGLMKDGVWWQDLAIVRQPYSYRADGKIVFDPAGCEVLVYADKDNEDFTDEFYVGIHEEE